MKKLSMPLLLFVLFCCCRLRAQDSNTPQDSSDVRLIDRAHAQDWLSDINRGWLTHAGDDLGWANPTFDDSGWELCDSTSWAPHTLVGAGIDYTSSCMKTILIFGF